MIPYAEAIQIVLEFSRRGPDLKGESVQLDEACGRVAFEDILSQERIPPYANSAMDGFAVRSAQTRGASLERPLRLPVLGTIVAGDVPPAPASRQGAWEIMTGAPFPPDFDASIRIEDVRVIRNSSGAITEIEIFSEAAPEQNFRDAGEDFQIGAKVIRRGQVLQPEHLLALSSLGVTEVQAAPKPVVAVVSTGKELVSVGAPLQPGQIRNSTAHFLASAIRGLGAEARLYGIVPDDPARFHEVMERILADRPDVVITTGAVSMGKHDFVATALHDLGAEMFFHKVAIRPGKPVLFASFPDGPVVFGLPGNPVSTVVGLRFFVEPFLRARVALPQEMPLRARLAEGSRKPEGLRCFFKADLRLSEWEPKVRILPGQLSFLVRPLLESNAWAVLPEEKTELLSGTWVDVYPLHSSAYRLSSHSEWKSEGKHKKGCC